MSKNRVRYVSGLRDSDIPDMPEEKKTVSYLFHVKLKSGLNVNLNSPANSRSKVFKDG